MSTLLHVVCGQAGLAVLFAKFRALQLAAGNMHGPDNSSATHNPRWKDTL